MFDVIDTDLFKQKNKSKIKVQIITEEPDKKLFPKIGKKLKFNIRSIHDSPKAHFLIIDEKELFLKSSTKGFFAEMPSIWTTNSCLVAISQNYFETLWNKSL